MFRLALVVIYQERGTANTALLVKHLKIEQALADYLITRLIKLKAIIQKESGYELNYILLK